MKDNDGEAEQDNNDDDKQDEDEMITAKKGNEEHGATECYSELCAAKNQIVMYSITR